MTQHFIPKHGVYEELLSYRKAVIVHDGTATVYTNVRKGLPEDMPNVTRFLKNYVVPVTMMNSIMVTMHEKPEMKARDAALDWVAAHPEVAAKWLEGVTTKDGEPGLPAFRNLLDPRK
jgi:glycine betaine/proline transport system substrate-binding protein